MQELKVNVIPTESTTELPFDEAPHSNITPIKTVGEVTSDAITSIPHSPSMEVDEVKKETSCKDEILNNNAEDGIEIRYFNVHTLKGFLYFF